MKGLPSGLKNVGSLVEGAHRRPCQYKVQMNFIDEKGNSHLKYVTINATSDKVEDSAFIAGSDSSLPQCPPDVYGTLGTPPYLINPQKPLIDVPKNIVP